MAKPAASRFRSRLPLHKRTNSYRKLDHQEIEVSQMGFHIFYSSCLSFHSGVRIARPVGTTLLAFAPFDGNIHAIATSAAFVIVTMLWALEGLPGNGQHTTVGMVAWCYNAAIRQYLGGPGTGADERQDMESVLKPVPLSHDLLRERDQVTKRRLRCRVFDAAAQDTVQFAHQTPMIGQSFFVVRDYQRFFVI